MSNQKIFPYNINVKEVVTKSESTYEVHTPEVSKKIKQIYDFQEEVNKLLKKYELEEYAAIFMHLKLSSSDWFQQINKLQIKYNSLTK